MNASTLRAQIDAVWDDSIVPTLHDYIRVPAQSPQFDPDWERNGYIDEVVRMAKAWVDARGIAGLTTRVLRIPGRTPILLVERPGDRAGTLLLYGHLDKQPPFTGWRPGLGPWEPVYTPEGKLYGRGASDDGYAVFASVCALEALLAQGESLPRVTVLIECSEESGSSDLPAYLEAYGDALGTPDLIVCLDSGAGDYERLWLTTSLRGLVIGTLRVKVLENGVHSGDASGVVPSSFRIARLLLDRLEDPVTGRLRPAGLHCEIPESRRQAAERVGAVLGSHVWDKFPFVGETTPMGNTPADLVLNRTWRPTLSVTGADGLPETAKAGNVLRPETALRLSIRIPPTVEPDDALALIRGILLDDPPYGATVTLEDAHASGGWAAPELAPWLSAALDAASSAEYGAPSAAMGEGGSIPFMGMLGQRFPKAQFLITGVLGPESNAHGPNEFLHVPYAKRLTACVARIVAGLPG